ncbi:MAG TPA: NlpC/P60 family protein [Solirubrobacteraceae bacterium]|nr:NlpC/P60 family protein [Solirubrobacteraceae bacterium]
MTRRVRMRLRRWTLATAALIAGCALIPATASAAVTLSNWDAAQQRQVVQAGLMRNLGRSFQGASAITAAQANAAFAALAARLQNVTGAFSANAVQTARDPVTVVSFDRMLVAQLGLSATASQVQATAAGAGLRPPSYFGSEVVARFLRLRYNHPSGTDQLELFPTDPITRAEAAWSLAQVVSFGDWNVSSAEQSLSGFQLPAMSSAQRQVLQIAVSRIGYPYVWGGTTDDTSDGLAHGGFDCSGFAWRVYKVSGLPWGQRIRGRTAAQQAGEIPKRARLRMSQLQPGDVLFFGSAGYTGAATEASIIHEGIYLGENWVIHSSNQGVYVLPLQGSWLGNSFAWGRRVIG